MSDPTPHAVLKKYWGYDNFRPLQLDIIESVLAGHDTLGLMPTGGGKSVTFQVPAMILPGLTVVVTPLISLMKDQVDNLRTRHIRAGALYLGQTSRERNLVCDRARLGKIKLLYVSPERLRNETFRLQLAQWNVSLLVVDEAHCISQWGYDFRPSYLKIALLRDILPDVPVLALTASATPVVRNDIIARLDFRQGHNAFTLSFHRSNLSYVVRNYHDKGEKLIEALSAVGGSAIVYVRSRARTAKIAEDLTNAGISATFYHAGLDSKLKEERQQLWKTNGVRVMVATNAFGMGIDKPDVRIVVHVDLPPTLEEYYQEAGRAGRDGLPSYALLIVSQRDKATLTRRLNAAFPPRDYILKVYEQICVFMDVAVGEGYDKVFDFDINKFCQVFKLDPDTVRGAIAILTNAGYIEYVDDPVSRARVQVIIRREELYDINLVDDEQHVINALFRLYPGLFADYVPITEDSVASLAGIGAERTYQSLLSLTRKHIISYIPKRLLPYIYLPTSRELTRYITIPRAVYEDRRRLMEERTDAVRRFAFGTDVCRDRVLLNYFGEEDVADCGLCDVCVERRKAEQRAQKGPDTLKRLIVEQITAIPGISPASLLKALRTDIDAVEPTLRALIADGHIHLTANRLYVAKK